MRRDEDKPDDDDDEYSAADSTKLHTFSRLYANEIWNGGFALEGRKKEYLIKFFDKTTFVVSSSPR